MHTQSLWPGLFLDMFHKIARQVVKTMLHVVPHRWSFPPLSLRAPALQTTGPLAPGGWKGGWSPPNNFSDYDLNNIT